MRYAVVPTSKNTDLLVHMQLWHVDMKQKIHLITLLHYLLYSLIGRLTSILSYQLVLKTLILQLQFNHQSLRNSAADQRPRVFRTLQGSGRPQNARIVKTLGIILELVD